MTHFVVVFKISEKYVVVGDPAKDLLRLTIDEFYKNFTGAMLILLPNQEFETGKIKGGKILDRYLALLKPQTKLFAYGILASLLMTLLGIVSSIFNNVLFDEILPYRQENVLKLVIIVFLGINITQVVVSFVRQWMMMHLSIKIDIPLMLGYFKHIYNLPMKFFSTRKTRDIIIGSFMAFNTLAGYFMEPVGNLVSLQLSLQEANISMMRFSEILDYEEEQSKSRENVTK